MQCLPIVCFLNSPIAIAFSPNPQQNIHVPNLSAVIFSLPYKDILNLLMIPIRREYVYIFFDVSSDTFDINSRTLEGSVCLCVVVKQNNINKQ